MSGFFIALRLCSLCVLYRDSNLFPLPTFKPNPLHLKEDKKKIRKGCGATSGCPSIRYTSANICRYKRGRRALLTPHTSSETPLSTKAFTRFIPFSFISSFYLREELKVNRKQRKCLVSFFTAQLSCTRRAGARISRPICSHRSPYVSPFRTPLSPFRTPLFPFRTPLSRSGSLPTLPRDPIHTRCHCALFVRCAK